MIVLDTNVLSEPLKPQPSAAVLDWLDAQAPGTLYLSAITVAELLAGIECLPAGRRRTQLRQAWESQIHPLFAERVLSFDEAAAETFAVMHAKAQARGHAIGFADGAIAAIALAHGFAVATRNTRDFEKTGVALIDPWLGVDA